MTMNRACRYCEERITAYSLCSVCHKLLVDECAECHAELAHGVIPLVTDSAPGVSTREDEAGPWCENAVRALEDAGGRDRS
jgi:hypothetical protein